ncbi:CPXCG motif-containing cysteine-rich protein [Mesonia aquimarina]|uniref:CPXCG motif-containing cysteine-rich protein n=1 Tax=Mesonia aquimarina TaxID=1504967 RepID=UPI000EF60C7E|nr:CPXCG motif-containing cysteine-rich protein [Mesonia aquimarina]
MLEHFFQCPHCWEEISMLLDPSVSQTYVEDCEVCCNPIKIEVKFESGNLIDFRTGSLEQ